MKRLVFLFLLIFSTTTISAQNFDQYMTKRNLGCEDVSYNSSIMFMKYYISGQLDSTKLLLDYWESKCGLREPLYRAKTLLALKEKRYTDKEIKSDKILSLIFNFNNRMDASKEADTYTYDNYKSYFGFVPINGDFDAFTKNAFSDLKPSYSEGSIESLLCEFYGGNHEVIFSKLQTNEYANTPLGEEYSKEVAKYLKMAEIHVSAHLGVWIPTGELTKIGIHPEIGLSSGWKHKKMNYDFILGIRFLKSPNYYEAYRTGSTIPELTNQYLGGYLGFDLGRDVYAKKGHEIQILGGIGMEGFDALDGNESLRIPSASIWSYSFNFGLGYRFYISNTLYIGVRAKYNFVDYTINKAINFTGNPVTIQIVIGGVDNPYRNNNLKALGYRLRK